MKAFVFRQHVFLNFCILLVGSRMTTYRFKHCTCNRWWKIIGFDRNSNLGPTKYCFCTLPLSYRSTCTRQHDYIFTSVCWTDQYTTYFPATYDQTKGVGSEKGFQEPEDEKRCIISCFPVGYRKISVKIFFDLTLVVPVKIPIFMFLLPRLIARASQPDGNMTSFTLNKGKELYWSLIKLLPETIKSMK